MKNLRNKAINFIHSTWNKNCNENFDIDTIFFNKITETIYNNLTKNKISNDKPFIFRTCGQSGSGKTTQLRPAIDSILNDNFIKIAIRDFVKYHPNYNEFIKDYEIGLIREKTNGYGLLLCFKILEFLIINHFNILLEVTILDNSFEEYISNLLKQNNYTINYHILSIPKNKSDLWIEKRKTETTENKRIVLKSSSDFFYNILPKTLNKLINYNIWNQNDKIILWNGFEFEPIHIGNIKNNKKFIELFNKYRNIDFQDVNEKELLKNKINWFKNYYTKNDL